MAVDYRSSDGCWSVEVVRLAGTPDRHDGEWLRIRYFGWYVHDAHSVAELEHYVSLSELEDALLGTGAGLSRFSVRSTSMARSALDFLSFLAAMAVIPATSRSTASEPYRKMIPMPVTEATDTTTSGGMDMSPVSQ